MVVTFDLVMYVVAAICFALATAGVKVGSLNVLALGLLCWVLTLIF